MLGFGLGGLKRPSSMPCVCSYGRVSQVPGQLPCMVLLVLKVSRIHSCSISMPKEAEVYYGYM